MNRDTYEHMQNSRPCTRLARTHADAHEDKHPRAHMSERSSDVRARASTDTKHTKALRTHDTARHHAAGTRAEATYYPALARHPSAHPGAPTMSPRHRTLVN